MKVILATSNDPSSHPVILIMWFSRVLRSVLAVFSIISCMLIG